MSSEFLSASDTPLTEKVFEHPLNERMRIFLRLEHLFDKVAYFRGQPSPWCSRATIDALLDILAITGRTDLRGELLKEMDRNLSALDRIRHRPGVDRDMLDDFVEQLAAAIHALGRVTNPLAVPAREDELLKAVAQRNSIPGGTCSFDLPQYHDFLLQPPEWRAQRFAAWCNPLEPAREALRLVLFLARASTTPRPALARQGFFQEALDPAAPAQLVRVMLDAGSPYFPEISGHKNRYNIRFLSTTGALRPSQTAADVSFRLSCYAF